MQTLQQQLESRGVSRREFVKFCGVVAGALAVPVSAIADSLTSPAKLKIVRLTFQACGGNGESMRRATKPSIAQLLLDALSAEQANGDIIAIVDGAIPTKDGGIYCTIDGKPALQIAREVCGKAAATIAAGNCAAFGGIAAADPNPTGARGVGDAVPHVRNLINLPACPVNVENLTALLVHYQTFGAWPQLDAQRRPLFAYGKTIHDNCERRAHFDAGQFVREWGDDAHRLGYCLYAMGCKGAVASHNCPNVRWNGGANWTVAAGHPCVGCTEAKFWDRNAPFYRHMPTVKTLDIDTIGAAATGVLVAGVATQKIVAAIRKKS